LRLTTFIVLAFMLVLVRVGTASTAVAHKSHSSSKLAGERAAKYAKRWLGVPYRWGGTSPRTGFDCSGFVRFVWARFGVHLAHSSYAQYGSGHWIPRRALRPGDLVFFHGVGHVGLYLGHNRFVHAPHSGAVVSIASLSGAYGAEFVGARRVQ
jgi:cell wall-associated NlpC family hydrolase